MTRIQAVCWAAGLSLAVAGCAGASDDYPSLAIRDAERLVGMEDTAPPPTPPAPIPGAIIEQANGYVGKASRADANFRAKTPSVERAVSAARGAAVASDRWSNAQVALSELDSLRATTAIALADLDALFAARAIELERRDAIGEARNDVAAILSRQDAVLGRLKSQLRQ